MKIFFFFLVQCAIEISSDGIITSKSNDDKGILVNLIDGNATSLNCMSLVVKDSSISAQFNFNFNFNPNTKEDSSILKLDTVKCNASMLTSSKKGSVILNPEEPNSGFIFYIAAALMVGIVAVFMARRRGISFSFYRSGNNGTNGIVTAINKQYTDLPTDEESRHTEDNDDNTNNDNYTDDRPLVKSTPALQLSGRVSNPDGNNGHSSFPASNSTSTSYLNNGSIPKKSKKENLGAVPVKQNPTTNTTTHTMTTTSPTQTNSSTNLAYNPDDNQIEAWSNWSDDVVDDQISTKKEKPDKKD